MVPRHRRMKVAGETSREKRAAQGNLCMLCEGPWLGGEVGNFRETSGLFHRPPCIQWRGRRLEPCQADSLCSSHTNTQGVEDGTGSHRRELSERV